MKTLRLLFAPLVFIAAAQLSSAAAATSTLTIPLHEQNGSGQNGTATLTQQGPDVNVVLDVKGEPSRQAWNGEVYDAAVEPAHIHQGTCADLKGVAYPLSDLVTGKSTTLVKGVTIDQLVAGTYAINVHTSASHLDKYVACGNIVAS
jgi:hypothetical protein